MEMSGFVRREPRLSVGRWDLCEGRSGAGEGRAAGGAGSDGRGREGGPCSRERSSRIHGELVGRAARSQGSRTALLEVHDCRRTIGHLECERRRVSGELRTALLESQAPERARRDPENEGAGSETGVASHRRRQNEDRVRTVAEAVPEII